MPRCKNKNCNKNYDQGKGKDGYCPECAQARKSGALGGKRNVSGQAGHHTNLSSVNTSGGRHGGK